MDEFQQRGASKNESDWGTQLREKMLSYTNKTGANGEEGPVAKKQKTQQDSAVINIMFSASDSVSALINASQLIKEYNLKLIQIESRPSKADAIILEFLVTVATKTGDHQTITPFVESLKTQMTSVTVLQEQKVPWFPKTLDELNPCLGRVLYSELEPSHPGYNDPVYQAHRKICADNALNYTFDKPIPSIDYTAEEVQTWNAIITRLKKHYPTNACKEFNEIFPALCEECNLTDENIPQMEQVSNFIKKYRAHRKICADNILNYTFDKPIPSIDYTAEEVQTWNAIITRLQKHYPTNACKEFNEIFPALCEECDLTDNNIPQMEQVSNFIKQRTGFRLRPVSALLSSRDFLSALAFRVFPATQYLRHSSSPFYTPEPDLCHELLGHASLLANPDFAEFSQEIGLASLGAPDEYIDKLSTVYWFTVEFGMCQEHSGMKAYGAGLLSSVGEIQHCLTGKSKVKPFDPEVAMKHTYPMDGFQTLYFVASSFLDALQKMRSFADKIPRPFTVSYNPYNCSIEVLDSKERLQQYTRHLKGELNLLMDAVNKLK